MKMKVRLVFVRNCTARYSDEEYAIEILDKRANVCYNGKYEKNRRFERY